MKKLYLALLVLLCTMSASASKFWNFSDTSLFPENDTIWTTTTVDGLTFVTDGSSAERVPIFQSCGESPMEWTSEDGRETLTFPNWCKLNGKTSTAYRWMYFTAQPGDTIEAWSNSTSSGNVRTNTFKLGYSGATIGSYKSMLLSSGVSYGSVVYKGSKAAEIALVSDGSNYWYGIRLKSNPDFDPEEGGEIEQRWFFKHGWGDGTDASWDWRELYANADKTVYSRMDVYGATGCNYSSDEYGSGSVWVPLGSDNLTLIDDPQIGDSAEFSFTPATLQISIRKTKDAPEVDDVVLPDSTLNISLAGGKVFFDNSVTQWSDESIYFVAGNSVQSVTVLMLEDENGKLSCPMPYIKDTISYVAVIGNSHFSGGAWGPDNLVNANHYSATYSSQILSSAKDGWQITPMSADNGCELAIEKLEGDYEESFTSDEVGCGYRLNDKLRQITFLFSTSKEAFVVSPLNVSKVYVYGSISNWSQKDEDYVLHGYADQCFYMTMPYSMIERTGNGGQPEYLFNVIRTNGNSYVTQCWSTEDGSHSSTAKCPAYNTFCSNGYKNVVAWNDDDTNDLLARKTQALYIRPLSDFDLTTTEDQENISNFRRVPGTKHLYRSYHPYHSSRSQYDTEHERIVWVDNLATQVGIKCDLALSGSNESEDGTGSYTVSGVKYTTTIPPYYREIIDNGRVLYVGTENGHTPSYDYALYYTDSERFAQWIQEIVLFINNDDHPVPFQLHCALGADRTGVFSGVFAALCGASWDDIAADYNRTSNLQISEYRHSNQVRYALYRLTGFDPMILPSGENAESTVYTATTFEEKKAASQAYTGGSMLFTYPEVGTTLPTLKDGVAQHFIDSGLLTKEEIDAAVTKLRGDEGPSDVEELDADAETNAQKSIYKVVEDGKIIIVTPAGKYDLLGAPVK